MTRDFFLFRYLLLMSSERSTKVKNDFTRHNIKKKINKDAELPICFLNLPPCCSKYIKENVYQCFDIRNASQLYCVLV